MGVFETLLRDGISRGHVPEKSQSAREWYGQAAKNFGARIRGQDKRVDYKRGLDKRLIREYGSDGDRTKPSVEPGSMYMYAYDPKYRDTLPYYDRFPLVFPFRVKRDRFWGINLHYISPPMRAKLMDSLHDIANNRRFDESTKLNLSYQALNTLSKARFFQPCVKQYLISHTKTKFMYVKPEEWSIAIWLPSESFAKKSKSQVWSASKTQLGISR